MEYRIVFITLLIGFCHGGGCDEQPEEDGSSKFRYYPCGRAVPIDEDCVRNFFVCTGQCTAVCHSDGDPIYMPRQIGYIPTLNLTIDCTDVKATYYGSRIVAFYINTLTKNLVMAVDFTGLGMESPLAYMILAQNRREPLVLQDYVKVTYGATLTAYVPWLPGITPEDVIVSAYNTIPFPCFDIGPNVTQSKNPVVQHVLKKFLVDRSTVVQELFLTKAYYYFFGYLQKYICDWGYKYSGDVNK